MSKRNESNKNLGVDVRFFLANERTFLAWARTGLTLIAGGVAMAFIAPDIKYGTFAGLGAIGFGGVLTLVGYVRYRKADTSIKTGELPETGIGGLMVVMGILSFAVLLLVAKHFNVLI